MSDISNMYTQNFASKELNILFPHSLRFCQEELETMNLWNMKYRFH